MFSVNKNHAVILALALTLNTLSAQAADHGWALNQINSYAPSGKWLITLGADGLRVEDGTMVLLFTAPDFDACILNESSKQYAAASRTEWNRTFVHKDTKDSSSSGKYFRQGTKTGKIAGLRVKQSFLCIKEQGKERVLREVWTTSEIKLPKKNSEVLNELCHLPLGEGVPLRITRIFFDGNREAVLNTLEAKKIPIVAATFTRPQGYKKARSAAAVMLSTGPGKDLTEMMAPPESK
jgi:hypothetical protein